MAGVDEITKVDLNKKLNLFNSFNDDQQKVIRELFFRDQKKVITEVIGSFNYGVLFPSSFGACFRSDNGAIEVVDKDLVSTNFRFSDNILEVPAQIDLLCRIIFTKKFNQKGLFKVNTVADKMKTARTLLYDILEGRVSEETGIGLFDKNFDLIDCCELYKLLLRSFNKTVIPLSFIKPIIEASKETDLEKKMIASKAIFYSLPTHNRKILESNIFLCYKICQITHSQENVKEQLDLDGLAIVMMPNLFLENENDFEIDSIIQLVSFAKFLFANIFDIMDFDEKYKNANK
ncbi:hypothetical protein A0H76_1282 [Hepatospora eriocheir]|uniref:Rho-GAP domain-containing protein n=1 Tax=Hepatospora eriocheir TaxID=1081669 RepID=A0A1X0QHC6_9MICR|nr:hypothetical protein A0H76_1282 [Hepatospora eriocheir]